MNAFLEPVILNTLIYSKMSPYRSKNHWKSPLASIMNRMRYSTLKASKQMDAQSSNIWNIPVLIPCSLPQIHTHIQHTTKIHTGTTLHIPQAHLSLPPVSLSLSLWIHSTCAVGLSAREHHVLCQRCYQLFTSVSKYCPEPCPYSQSKSHTYSHRAISLMFVHKVHVFETQYQQSTS